MSKQFYSLLKGQPQAAATHAQGEVQRVREQACQQGASRGHGHGQGRQTGHILAWLLTILACAWVALCTALGPIYRANDTIAHFGLLNWLIFIVTFAGTLGLVYLASSWNNQRATGSNGDQASGLLARGTSAIRTYCQQAYSRLEERAAAHPGLRRTSRWAWRVTQSWQGIMLLLLVGWFWVWATLLASFGADLVSQSREVASWLATLSGAHLPYRQGPTVMDVYPTAHYLWPAQPTYLTDQHNLPLTLLYGGAMALSRQLTGVSDLGIIALAALQLVFAAFCCAVTANRFFQPARASHLPQDDGQPALAAAGSLARALTLAFLLVCPLVVLSTISLTKSPLFAFSCLWWLGIGYQLHLTRKGGGRLPVSSAWGLALSTLVMLCSAKYAVYLVAIQVLVAVISDRKRWKTYLVCLLLPLIIFQGGMTGLFASGAVIKGDPIESKGIQLQQIARVAQRNPAGIPESAREDLVPIMDLDAAGMAYFPNDADKVKSSGNKRKIVVYRWQTVSAADMKAFNRAWAQIGRQNPTIYVDAFLAECYGYFDPADAAYVPMSYYANNGYVQEDTHWIRYWCHGWRDFVAGFAHGWAQIPILGWPARGNFWVIATLLLMACEALRGRWRDLLYQLPLLLLMGVMVASPANNFERHMLPLVFAFPFLLIAFHLRTRQERAQG
ncbi:hypothetical protein KIM372_15460 [Bombiscardovia nodaiensis]|uniref:Beta-carotene 15,15'-monooxygenase n=1 Tax=Bombiscardovia nodaiensis TaxID=2932181 RepID=A0ABN6SC14_9BIFI|nr:hypothetical protein KIM372_15460 [Bombiscardovia nodaiensis]